MDSILASLSAFLWGLPLILTMVFVGLYFTIGSRFFQFRHLPHILKATFSSVFKKDKEEDGKKGVMSSFEAVATAIGGSVGVANIGGVATAIAVGGPGAIFWMWMTALLGMIIKTVEVTLSVYYRRTDENGEPYGGPTYYMERGLGEERNFKYWIFPAAIFGFGIFSTFFITMQNYTISEAISSTFHIGMIPASILFSILVYFVVWGGIKHIGKLASKLVPAMVLFYVVAGLFIIITNISQLGSVFALIFNGAFGGTAAVGGFAGAAMAQAIRMGMARSVYSNEAGWGTSPMIHSTAKVDHPIKQGIWGAFEVFIDTIIVSSITAFTIIITGAWSSGLTGADLTLTAFETGIGSFGRIAIAVSILLFGLTTVTGWYSYYEIVLRHLLKGKTKAKDRILKTFIYLYPIPGTLMVVYGVAFGLPGQTVWYFADISSAVPTFINVVVLLILGKQFFVLLNDYKARYLGIGKIDPDLALFYEDKVEKEKANKKAV